MGKASLKRKVAHCRGSIHSDPDLFVIGTLGFTSLEPKNLPATSQELDGGSGDGISI